MIYLLASCAECPPLIEVPVDGGSEDDRGIVRDTLDALDREVDLPVCIDHVRLDASLPDDREGVYNSVTRRIRVSDAIDGDQVPGNVRHEVCHGIDLQNDLVRGRESQFGYPTPPPIADARVPNEAFALTCELGADRLSVLWADDCPLDPDLRAAEIVRDEVFGVAAQPAPTIGFAPIASAELDDDVVSVSVLPTLDGHLGAFVYHDGGSLEIRLLDPWSGAWLDGAADEPFAELDGAIATSWPVAWNASGDEHARGGMLGETTVVTASMGLVTGRVHRTHALVDGVWEPVDSHCPNETTQFFYVSGELWSSQIDGGRLTWGSWRDL